MTKKFESLDWWEKRVSMRHGCCNFVCAERPKINLVPLFWPEEREKEGESSVQANRSKTPPTSTPKYSGCSSNISNKLPTLSTRNAAQNKQFFTPPLSPFRTSFPTPSRVSPCYPAVPSLRIRCSSAWRTTAVSSRWEETL